MSLTTVILGGILTVFIQIIINVKPANNLIKIKKNKIPILLLKNLNDCQIDYT